MLGKLIRYDGRLQMKFFGGLYAIMGVVALISAILKGAAEYFDHLVVVRYAYQMAWFFCRITAVVLVLGSIIYVIFVYRRNLLKDEGYFMHTLPAPAWQLFVSKLITGTGWILLSVAVAVIGYLVGKWSVSLPFLDVLQESGVTGTKTVLLCSIALFLTIPAFLCEFYAGLSLGYTWGGKGNFTDRDILSVVALVLIYIGQQIVGVIVLLLFLIHKCGSIFKGYFLERMLAMFDEMDRVGNALQIQSYVQSVMEMAIGETVFVCVVLSVIAVWRMNKHLNME